MLEDILALFRRRRASVRRRKPAGDPGWRINLASSGGAIFAGRGDSIPRAQPPMRRPDASSRKAVKAANDKKSETT